MTTDGTVLKIKPALHTLQNIASVFDAALVPDLELTRGVPYERETAVYLFRKKSGHHNVLALGD